MKFHALNFDRSELKILLFNLQEKDGNFPVYKVWSQEPYKT